MLGRVYRFYETFGIPFSVIFDVFAKHGAYPCWITLYEDGLSAGIKSEKWLRMIDTAISDSLYGCEVSKEVTLRLRAYIRTRTPA